GRIFLMNRPVVVQWTERSLRNARAIKKFIFTRFTEKEVLVFETLLEEFETTESIFQLYILSPTKKKNLRRAVIHKRTTVYYDYSKNIVPVIAMKDNSQQEPSR
ncbi:MAG TPA: hypothetical protein VFD35_09400, partial [Pricia sp.]|nr:hypothetical protein [Pricia sp.]